MPPLNVLIKPASSACNMRCKYCFYEDEAVNRSVAFAGMMNEETTENLIKKAALFAEGSCNFMFQGGEPTLAGLEFYRSFLETEKKYKKDGLVFNHAIQTNGFALDEEWIKFFKENNFFVGLSLDGSGDLHDLNRLSKSGNGTFSRVLRAAQLMKKEKVEFNVLSVVTSKAARSIEKTYNFFKKQGFDCLQFIDCLDPLDGAGRFSPKNEEYAAFLSKLFSLWFDDLKKGRMCSIRLFDNWFSILFGGAPEACNMCGRCTVQFVIEGDGSVYPCDFYALDEYKLGNINENSFEDIIESEKAKQFVEASLTIPDECRKCRWYPLCRNGCRREREALSDNSYGKTRRCEAFKRFFEENEHEIAKAMNIIRLYNSKVK